MARQQVAKGGLESLWVGQVVGGKDNQGGPYHHKVEVVRSGALTPRLARSAGLSADRTCLQT